LSGATTLRQIEGMTQMTVIIIIGTWFATALFLSLILGRSAKD